MDVTCERCSTAYEFDDALVSERGTTVKCTNCGHQFKVRRPQPLGGPERWIVRTIDGRELEFRALRELQAAIAVGAITRDDVLSRGGSRPRRLGNIAELEPFFVSAGSPGGSQSTSLGLGPRGPAAGMPPPRARVPTPQGLGAVSPPRAAEVSIAIPLPRGPAGDLDALAHPPALRPPSVPPAPRRVPSVPPPASAGPLPGVIVAPGGAPPLPPPPLAPVIPEDAIYDDATRAIGRPGSRPDLAPSTNDVAAPSDAANARASSSDDWASADPKEAPTQVMPGPPSPDARARAALLADAGIASPRAVARVADASEEPGRRAGDTASVPPLAPSGVRISYADDLGEPRFSQAAASRREGAARWIVGVVVLGMAVLIVATLGRRMLASSAPPAKASESDARIAPLLADGEKSLADGDLESAKEQFDKASVLGDCDPRAVGDLARLATAKADVDWLRVQLLAPDDPERANLRRALEQAAQRAKKAADHASEIAAADPVVIRSRIDALRISGDIEGARKLVSGISAASAQPENALALAELDLAEANPDWSTVLGRLRAALSTDGNLGRARSMLVYALARSGDGTGARAELERLGALTRPHPLLGALRAYVNRTAAPINANALPEASAKPSAKPAPAAPAPAREPKSREKPSTPSAPVEPSPQPPPEIAPPNGPIDTSDLPGVKGPTPSPTGAPTGAPATPTPTSTPTSTLPPGVDTSDLPGLK